MGNARYIVRHLHWVRIPALGFVLAVLGFARPVPAQTTPTRVDAAEVRKQYLADLDRVSAKFIALANAFPADKYSWRPTPQVRSVGAVFMHVASEYYLFSPMAFGAPGSPVVKMADLGKFEANPSKEMVLKHLQNGLAYAKGTIGAVDINTIGPITWFGRSTTVAETATRMTADLHEHLGQLITYARINGITPPWSK